MFTARPAWVSTQQHAQQIQLFIAFIAFQVHDSYAGDFLPSLAVGGVWRASLTSVGLAQARPNEHVHNLGVFQTKIDDASSAPGSRL